MENIGIEKFRKGNFAISTRTQGEYNKLMEILDEHDFVWTSGSKPSEYNAWRVYGKNTSILNDNEDNSLYFGKKSTLVDIYNMKVITLEEFIIYRTDTHTTYNKGDEVRVKRDLKQGFEYDVLVNDEMEELAGNILTISGVEPCGYYRVDENEWCWTEDMFESDAVELNSTFTKSDLQDGDILIDRDNDVSIIKDGEAWGRTLDLDRLDESLKNKGGYHDYDIVRVIRPNADNIVFERNKLIVEYTTRELERKLGHKFIIKDEN